MSSMSNENLSKKSVNGGSKPSKSSSNPTKKAIDPKLLTPEYIAEQRKLRELRKEKARKEKEALGLLPPPEKDDKFLKRPMLDVSKAELGLPNIKIMSYNVLAQTLIRREIYPTNGKILKWSVRSHILLDELKYYDADILCLQEVDKVQYNSFWSKEFEKLGYGSKFYRYNTKNHGCVIVFRKLLFDCKNQSFIKLDQDLNQEDDEIKLPYARIATNNIGFMVYLEFQPKFVEQYPSLENSNGIIIGTTHLFWHPFGTYERTRQMYILLYKFKEFQHVLNIILGNNKKFYSFFTGDFNSEPFDAPYRAITTKPIKFAGRSKNVLGCSLSYTFSKGRSLDDDGDGDDEEANEAELEQERDNNPDDPEPDTFDPTPEQDQLMTELEEAHNDLDIRAISLYSVGYKQAHEENANHIGHRNEPAFSNWVDKWNGMLDYIFLLVPWNKLDDYSERIDTPEELAKQYNIRLLKLLRLPTPKEMGPPPSGQPRMHQYPSDHLCIVAEIQLL